MREAYREDLASIGDSLVDMVRQVTTAMGQATSAVLEVNEWQANLVIDHDHKVDLLRQELEDRAIALLARQQPVATELRTVVTALRMSAAVERSGDLACRIAKLARMRYPVCAIPDDLRGTVADMGQLAQQLMNQAAEVITSKNVEEALRLAQSDGQMDQLHRILFDQLREVTWPHGCDTAVDVALAARYYERYADHATSLGYQVIYLVTGGRTERPGTSPTLRAELRHA
jgi:phosphate transport system protein